MDQEQKQHQELIFTSGGTLSRPPRVLPYLCVSHAGGSDERLLHGVVLGEGRLLLGWWRLLLLARAPVTLDEELHHLHVAPQGGVNQGTLAVLIQVVHLLTGM